MENMENMSLREMLQEGLRRREEVKQQQQQQAPEDYALLYAVVLLHGAWFQFIQELQDKFDTTTNHEEKIMIDNALKSNKGNIYSLLTVAAGMAMNGLVVTSNKNNTSYAEATMCSYINKETFMSILDAASKILACCEFSQQAFNKLWEQVKTTSILWIKAQQEGEAGFNKLAEKLANMHAAGASTDDIKNAIKQCAYQEVDKVCADDPQKDNIKHLINKLLNKEE